MSPRGEVREKCGDRTVLGIALDVHSCCCGSGEYYSTVNQDAVLLQEIVDTWEPSVREETRGFDDAVRTVCVAAIKEFYRQQEKVFR